MDNGEDDRSRDFLAESDSEDESGDSSHAQASEEWKIRQDQACLECMDGFMHWHPDVLGNEIILDDLEAKGGDSSHAGPLEIHRSREMSKLYVSDELTLPAVGHDGHYVVQLYPSGVKRTVVERANNILSIDEARANEAAVHRAMLEELARWHQLQAFERMPKKLATNLIDARWVLKWKEVNGKRTIQARLVVRGFKDTQAEQLSTFAGTTSRWGQRIINSVAAQYRWRIFSADVSQAFLRGLTFKVAAEIKDEVQRDVQFTVPPGSAAILKMLPGYETFDPLNEVIRMLRCGFGLKDAPRLWHKVLRVHLISLGLRPLQSDAQIYVWHVSAGRGDPSPPSPPMAVMHHSPGDWCSSSRLRWMT